MSRPVQDKVGTFVVIVFRHCCEQSALLSALPPTPTAWMTSVNTSASAPESVDSSSERSAAAALSGLGTGAPHTLLASGGAVSDLSLEFCSLASCSQATTPNPVRTILSKPTATTGAIRPRHIVMKFVIIFLCLHCCRSDSIPPFPRADALVVLRFQSHYWKSKYLQPQFLVARRDTDSVLC